MSTFPPASLVHPTGSTLYQQLLEPFSEKQQTSKGPFIQHIFDSIHSEPWAYESRFFGLDDHHETGGS